MNFTFSPNALASWVGGEKATPSPIPRSMLRKKSRRFSILLSIHQATRATSLWLIASPLIISMMSILQKHNKRFFAINLHVVGRPISLWGKKVPLSWCGKRCINLVGGFFDNSWWELMPTGCSFVNPPTNEPGWIVSNTSNGRPPVLGNLEVKQRNSELRGCLERKMWARIQVWENCCAWVSTI